MARADGTIGRLRRPRPAAASRPALVADILVVRQAPPERRGRVVAAFMTLIALGMPAGIGGAGLLLQYLPAQTAMLVLASAMAVVTGYGLSRPELRHAVWPTVSHGPGLPEEAGQRAG